MAKHFVKLQDNLVVSSTVLNDDVAPTEEAGANFLNNIYKTEDLGLAVPGYVWNTEHNHVTENQPYPSWVLNTTTWHYEAPIPYPESGQYQWDESTTSWKEST